MKLFDSHAHYNDRRFEEEYPGGATQAIADSFTAGVCGFLCVGTDPENSRQCINIAAQYPTAWAAAGLHPEDAGRYDHEVSQVLSEIETLLSHPKVVALGEIGLDYHWDTDRDLQHQVFDAQLSIAEAKKMPVIIHDREAHGDTMDILRAHKNVTGVLHSYSGSAEMAKEYMRMGWYVSFGGPLTYKNAEKVRDACKAADPDRLLIETDCPYLPPVPYRGKINFSGHMIYTLQAMAQCIGRTPEETAALTLKNACRLFSLMIPEDEKTL